MEKKDLCWFLVSEVSFNHDEEGVSEQSNSYLGGQEAEEGNYSISQDPTPYFFQRGLPPKPKTSQNLPK